MASGVGIEQRLQRRLAVVGSRRFANLGRVADFVTALRPTTVVVSGGARGVDAVAVATAMTLGRPYIVFPVPDWEWRRNRGAGHRRNELLLAHVDGVAVFWDGVSNGSAGVIAAAKRRGLWLRVFRE